MGVDESFVRLKHTTTFFDGTYSAQSATITIGCALAFYNAVELLLLIFTTFRRYSGLYFWSLLIASAGIIPYTIGFMIEYFQLTKQLAGELIATVGWPMMVTGQSLVLYSRLGVVLGPGHRKLLKGVKWMVIVDGIVFHISTTVVMFGSYNAHPNHPFTLAYRYIEKIQMTGFTLQEFIISGLYVWRTLDILNATRYGGNQRGRKTTIELLGINILIILMDLALLVVEYQNRHVIEQAVKQVVYSIKLKLEFAILSKLVNITQTGRRDSHGLFESPEQDTVRTGTEGTLDLGPFRSDDVKTDEKDDAWHVERRDSFILRPVDFGIKRDSILPVTIDQQHRRSVRDNDLYGGALRDLA